MKPQCAYVESIKIDPKNIIMDDQLLNQSTIESIAKSAKTVGIINAVSVTRNESGKLKIVAGRHRVAAAISAGLSSVHAHVLVGTDATLAQIEIDENVARRHLTPAEESELIRKRDAVLLAAGLSSQAERDKATADAMGRSVRTVRRLRTAAETLGTETIMLLAETSVKAGAIIPH
jgi:ParB family chromosome partitioning protein